MDQRRLIRLALALVVAAGVWLTQQYRGRWGTPVPPQSPPASQSAAPASPASAGEAGHPEVGFRNAGHLHQHYQKHGAEFGRISEAEYLRRAQELRDRPAGGDILEAVRADGVITRFDRASGAFLAFDRDLTIRTFFQPNDGERYFKRQLARGRSDS
ncbi:MAG TPA: hypothetical protein VLD58_13485 [Gemmatimonadales bacterium]|nr:hypothetical protein [Gemmatimonadales bacterium]